MEPNTDNGTTLTPVQKIVKAGVAFLLGLLTLFLSGDAFKQAVETAKEELDLQAASIEAGEKATPVQLVERGLNLVGAALEEAGDQKLADMDYEAENFVEAFDKNGGHPIAAGIKTWWTNLVSKFKKPAA